MSEEQSEFLTALEKFEKHSLFEAHHKASDELPNEAEYKFTAEKTIEQMITDLFAAEELGEGDIEMGYVKNFKDKDQVMVEYYERDGEGNWQTVLTRRFKISEVTD